jgi:putative transposase
LWQEFLELKEWCKKSLWAPSCYHGSVGHGWEVVEKYIAGLTIVKTSMFT